MPGFSEKDILIDQTLKRITLLMPAKLEKTVVDARIRVQCAACEVQFLRKDSTFTIYFCSPYLPILTLVDKSPKARSPVNYTVVLQPTGNLAIVDMPQPITYRLGEPTRINFSADNYFDGSTGLVLGRLKESSKFDTLSQVSDCMSTDARLPKQFFFTVNFYKKPFGEYELKLVKANGRQVLFPQPLIVAKGPPTIYGGGNLSLDRRQEYRLTGWNLYEEDGTSVLFRQKTGYTAELVPTTYDKYGTQLTVSLPNDIKPGYYYAQPLSNKEEYPPFQYGGIIVTEKAQQPYLPYHDITFPYDPEPLVVDRNVDVGTGVTAGSIPELDVTVQFVFYDVRDQQNLAIAPVHIPGGYWQGWTEGTGASFRLPATMTPGTYRLTPRFVLKDGTVIDGLPFPRLWAVR